MTRRFIRLTDESGLPVLVRPDRITHIVPQHSGGTYIALDSRRDGGAAVMVAESSETVARLIDRPGLLWRLAAIFRR